MTAAESEKLTPQQRSEAHAEKVAALLIELLEAGNAPWQKPWEDSRGAGFPANASTGKPYRGTNAVYLWAVQIQHGYPDDRWATFNQAKSLGAQVRKGEHGSAVIYPVTHYEIIKRDENRKPVLGLDGQPEKIYVKYDGGPRMKYYTVFNAAQIENMPERAAKDPLPAWERHQRAETILKESGASISHGGNRAYYAPDRDYIQLPNREQFDAPDKYYATALHELGHWTGHESRLKREGITSHAPFGSEGYAKEELRAEISSLMVGQELGIGHDPGQHAAYVKDWIKALKDDPKEIFRACTDASKIHDFVLAFGQEKVIERGREREAERISSGTAALRELWNAQGVPEARQNEMLAEIEAKAQPGAQVGPFTVAGRTREESEASAAWDAKYAEQEAMYRREHGAPATYADRIRADREAERERGERIISSPGYEPGDDPDAEIAAAEIDRAHDDDALDDVFGTSTTTKESEHTVKNKYYPFDADGATDEQGRPLFASDPAPEALYPVAFDDPEDEARYRARHGIPEDVNLANYKIDDSDLEGMNVDFIDYMHAAREEHEAEMEWKAEHMSEGDGLDPHERGGLQVGEYSESDDPRAAAERADRDARDIAKVREAARERGERIISAPGYVLGSNRHAEIAAAPDDPEAVIDGELGKVLAWSARRVGARVADALTGPVAAAGGVLADALAGVTSDDPAREITAHTPITAHTSEAEIAQIDTARDAADRADAADAARMRDEILDRYDREEKAAAARQELDSIPEIDDPELDDPELDDELGPEL